DPVPGGARYGRASADRDLSSPAAGRQSATGNACACATSTAATATVDANTDCRTAATEEIQRYLVGSWWVACITRPRRWSCWSAHLFGEPELEHQQKSERQHA